MDSWKTTQHRQYSRDFCGVTLRVTRMSSSAHWQVETERGILHGVEKNSYAAKKAAEDAAVIEAVWCFFRKLVELRRDRLERILEREADRWVDTGSTQGLASAVKELRETREVLSRH